MANRPIGYGLTAELARKNAAKFDPDLANDALDWMRDVFEHCEEEMSEGVEQFMHLDEVQSEQHVQEILRDGVLLCKLINCIRKGSVRKIHTLHSAFKQMENIGNFLKACEALGVKRCDLFQTVDLYEANNINQVINGICALGRRACYYYRGPGLGPEEARENKRDFTEEQLRAGNGVIGLQAGSNKGASQAGQNFGKTRAILD